MAFGSYSQMKIDDVFLFLGGLFRMLMITLYIVRPLNRAQNHTIYTMNIRIEWFCNGISSSKQPKKINIENKGQYICNLDLLLYCAIQRCLWCQAKHLIVYKASVGHTLFYIKSIAYKCGARHHFN